eukprot:jgi/Psemu1/297104/fgenesh1_pm.239_\
MSMSMVLLVLVFGTQLAPVLSNVDADVDPGADFGGYMQEMNRLEREERAYDAKLRAHDEWRQSTWGGFAVRKIQGLAYHFKPFFLAVQDALRESGNGDGSSSTATGGMMYVGVRMFLVVLFLAICYVGAKVLQLLVGSDYEVVQEIVIVHEHETEEEAAKARAATTRGKKVKSS